MSKADDIGPDPHLREWQDRSNWAVTHRRWAPQPTDGPHLCPCWVCGELTDTPKGGHGKLLCDKPECVRQWNLPVAPYHKVCECGRWIFEPRRGPMPKYCADCTQKRANERRRQWWAETANARRVQAVSKPCKVCGQACPPRDHGRPLVYCGSVCRALALSYMGFKRALLDYSALHVDAERPLAAPQKLLEEAQRLISAAPRVGPPPSEPTECGPAWTWPPDEHPANLPFQNQGVSDEQ